ncbi:MAG TPA: methyltransferase domain-containing protein [Kofleriaceae bacterium]|nr:methyltransferase domain-containing protein [Kofleriaceae bacterium]
MHGWEKWNDWYRREWRPVMEWMARASGAAPGQTALDLACGSGQPGFLVARAVGPGGKVIAIDISAEMLDVARRLAPEEGLDNLEFREGDIADLAGIADGSIDAATCGFALMFCPDPVRVARELHRVLRPGARFALCVWGDPARNQFLNSMFGAIGQVLQAPPPDPAAPGPYRLSGPGELESVLRAGGFTDVRTEVVDVTFAMPTREMMWEMFLDCGAPARRAVQGTTAENAARIKQAYFAALGPDEPTRVLATPLCATGVR